MGHGYALISIAAIGALLTAAAQQAPSLDGDWKGSGIVSSNLGVADHADCQVQYARAGERSFSYKATCTTESGTYDLTGSVTNTSGDRYSGTVSDDQQGREKGHVSLIQRGKYLSVRVTSSSGSARITLAKLG